MGAIAAVLIGVSSGNAHATSAKFAYVASGGDDTVVQFKVLHNNGLLTKIARAPATVAAGPFPAGLATATRGGKRFLYASNDNDSSISQCRIGTNGGLSHLNPAAFNLSVSPAFITADPKGQFAYVTSFSQVIEQLKISSDGTLSNNNPPTVTSPSGNSTVASVVDPTGKFLYVTAFGNNDVLEYLINADGTLTPNTAASIGSGGNPRNLAITASGKFVYVPNLNDGTVSQYTSNADGTLSANSPATLSLPSGAGPTQVVVNKAGTFAYVPDGNLGVVYQLKINPDGTLAMNSPATVSVQFADLMALDGGNKFAYVDDGGSLLYQFKVNSNGTLSPIPSAANSIDAGSDNELILLVPGGR